MNTVQIPAKSAESARRMCSAKLTLENDSVWYNLPVPKRTVESACWRLLACGEREVTNGEVERVLRGLDPNTLSSETRRRVAYVSPWYDSVFDPDCSRQVDQLVRFTVAPADVTPENVAACMDAISYYSRSTVTGRMSSTQPNIQQLPKEKPMSKPIEITTKTLINGSDISGYSDAELYEMIASEEKKIAELNKIENKPKRLIAEIEKRKAGIQALVNYLDSKAD